MSEEAFRQVDEKHVSNEICHMVWSPRIDLVALANIQGEVILHRLSWQKVWTLAPPGEGETVGGLAWRPDGKVLAVGYKSGQLKLCDVENAEVLHTMTVEGEVTSMTWISQVFTDGVEWTAEPYPEDSSADYLPKLQPLNKSYGTLSKGQQEENVEDSKRLKDQKELNLLLVGTNRDELQMFVYGIFHAAVVSISLQDGSQNRRVHSAILSQDLHCLSVVVESTLEMSDDIDYYLLTYDTTLFASRHKELRLLALKYGQIATLMGYLQTTIQQMSEAWEDILMAMDSKLLKFAEDKKKAQSGQSSSVSNDFLELLLFGTPSEELEQFLQHELTEKGLKKLGHSIETSYSNIQKLVVKHLQSVSQALVYHLSELRGMSLWYDKFGVLGLDTSDLQKAVQLAGSFVLNTSQLQQVIDGSIKNFKAFFRWLYVVILRLSNEQPPAELSKMTQHDVNFVAEFLRDNFTQFSPEANNLFGDSDSGKKSGFKLEKVGQYLKKENLSSPPDTSNNPWQQYLNASTFHTDSPVLYPVDSNHSLVQLQEQLVELMTTTVFHKPAVVIGQSLHCMCTNHLFTLTRPEDSTPRKPVFCQFTDVERQRCYTVFTADFLPCDKFLVLRQPTDPNRTDTDSGILAVSMGTLASSNPNSSSTSDSDRCSQHTVLDIAYYDPTSLSLLLQEEGEDGRPVLLQLSMSILNSSKFTKLATTENIASLSHINEMDIGSLVSEHSYRHLENMKAHSFAVSGTRKTATVLFSSKRRVRIFLMDAEEEEDDDDEEDITHGDGEMDKSQTESQSEPRAEDSQVMEDVGGDEDKENTSSIYSEDS
ncbi:anaphase-promoting complex subunit 4-like [Haliotis cracherodii]|uniref:anaphase-promoting complex subunit 4-like n=1 Tax=Haliotis cracherodii TaxID=6455 RepID=UPI0039E9A108